MSQVIPVHNPLRDTRLWKRLNEDFMGTADKSISERLAPNLLQICVEASDRMKGMSFVHPQYTLHDEKHLLRVVEIMSKIIPEDVLNDMNPIEITLLILAAYFHDQGMILDSENYNKLDSDPKFTIFRENWDIEHPNLKEVQNKLLSRTLNKGEIERCTQIEQELHQMRLSDYLRETHAQSSSEFVRSYSKDERWEISGTNISSLVAKLCYSHCQPVSDLTPYNRYFYDDLIGQYKVNVSYLALVLRLADILDLDRDRTPDTLFKTIHFTNNTSIREWEKHRSVEGWEISSERIRFSMRCEQPIYEKAAREFMDLIDDELNNAKILVDSFPKNFNKYNLELPTKTDRSRITAKDGAYEYHDLEFSLSCDEIVKLLMTDNLYDSPSLCVRELLQNSLDALRYRKALIKRDLGLDWDKGKVELCHYLNENGHEILRCIDNGVGMDINIIKRFLTKVGRSYYRSPEFNQERASLLKAGCDFDPCSQFGIGFMSCFMLGDRIIIHTRRDYGPNKNWGEPLSIEINGLSGMVVVRKGSPDQELGTSIEIFGRKKPSFFDENSDKVKLIRVIKNYAIACEFPISASCRIPEIIGDISVQPPISILTKLEVAKVEKCKTFIQNISEIDNQLSGEVRTSILIDSSGKLSIANSEASWDFNGFGSPVLRIHGICPLNSERAYNEQDQICLDGILVCGEPGRNQRGYWICNNYVNLGRESFILDVRGKLKPPLTPARTPPEDWRAGPRWSRLNDIAQKAHGRLWEQIARHIGEDVDDLTFWKLAVIHRAPIQCLRKQIIWDKLSVPVMKNGNLIEWQKISSLGTLKAENLSVSIDGSNQSRSYTLLTQDGNQIAPSDDIIKWEDSKWGGFRHKEEQLYATILGFCEIELKNEIININLKETTSPENTPSDSRIRSIFLLPFSSELAQYLSVQLPFNNANINHPLVKLAYDAKYLDDLSDIQLFARHMISYLGNTELWDELENNECNLNAGKRRALRYLGYLALNLSYPDGLQPPYILLSKNKTKIIIGQNDFERWAKLDPRDG